MRRGSEAGLGVGVGGEVLRDAMSLRAQRPWPHRLLYVPPQTWPVRLGVGRRASESGAARDVGFDPRGRQLDTRSPTYPGLYLLHTALRLQVLMGITCLIHIML
ncbi:unnamed protein product, partial [Musa acuminata var. zebrina]